MVLASGPQDNESKNNIPIPKRISVYAPDYFTTKLLYYKTFTGNTNSSTSIANSFYVLNSAYRPDVYGGGGSAHSANGYDIWAGIYKQHRVIGSVVQLKWTALDSGTNVPAITRVGYEILGNTDDMAPTFAKGMEKLHFHHVGDITQYKTTAADKPAGNLACQAAASYVYNPDKIPDNVADYSNDPSTWLAVNSAPTTDKHTINQWAVDFAGSNARPIQFEIRIIYTVQWRELRYDKGILDIDTDPDKPPPA